jgi:hypothetical protein
LYQTLIGYAIGLFIFSPINTIIHELGHYFFYKCFGGKGSTIHIGIGPKWFQIGTFMVIHRYYFFFGYIAYHTSIRDKNVIAKALIGLGGIIFNGLSLAGYLWFFGDDNFFLNEYYIGFTIALIISALIPITYPNSQISDGKYVLNLFLSKVTKNNTERR